MNSKLVKVFGDLIKKEFIPFFTDKVIEILSLDYDKESEDYTNLIKNLSQKYDETYVNVPKKSSPRKSPKKEEDQEVDLTYEEFVEKQKKNPDELLCSWIFNRGNKTNKHCARIVSNKEIWSEKQISDYEVRCDKCKRNNSEKSNATNKGRYLKIKIGNQVKGTPTPGVSLPESENEIPSMYAMTGLKEGVVSPTPENFLSGQDTGNVTPTKAKKRKSPKKSKLEKLAHGSKKDYIDYQSVDKINGHYILFRKNKDDDTYIIGGKFENDDDVEIELYLQGVIELNQDDLTELEKHSHPYKYCGMSKEKTPEIPDIPDLDSDNEKEIKDEEDLDDDDAIDDLIDGLDIN